MTRLAILVAVLAAASSAHAARPTSGFERMPHVKPAALDGQRTVIFLNRHGGTFYGAYEDDSQTNESYVVYRDTAQVPAWPYSDGAWRDFVACMRDMYARWDVEITDVDPGSLRHLEHVVGGHPSDIGQDDRVGGIASMNGDCSPMDNGISFTFAEQYGSVQGMCETAAQEIAHTLGLEHEYLCADPMTYLDGCGAKTFQDVDAQCGEGFARPCECPGRTRQNSVRMFDDILGPAADEPPSVRIASPADGAQVVSAVVITAEADDRDGIAKVDIHIDGQLVRHLTAPPWQASASGLAPGEHQVRVIATDRDGDQASATIGITVLGDDPEPVDPGNPGNPGNPGDPVDLEPPTDGGVVAGGCRTGQAGAGLGATLLVAACLLLGRRRRG
jgi:hypothetical protein